MYKCNTCNKLFKYKSDYTRHTKRKTPCKLENNNVKNFECSKCHKTYATNGSLNRHISNYCDDKTIFAYFPPDSFFSNFALFILYQNLCSGSETLGLYTYSSSTDELIAFILEHSILSIVVSVS